MSDIAIRVENLSKLYKIGRRQNDYRTLRESLASAFSAPLRWVKNPKSQSQNPNSDYIWALKDVSLEIKRGEVVGIVGRNGAGKSTLLKILSRITEPTEGYAEIHGRVGSLLEVGTGFHPELTGRENIFLNGAILGMKKVEIQQRFQEILEFAEIDKFIDTPMKHYSSGMYVRLAFAVAAHLEPEILIVDEVVAVGDLDFQKKCVSKMQRVANDGKTVLVVSHNIGTVRQLCNKCLLLSSGKLSGIGPTEEIIESYLSAFRPKAEAKLTGYPRREGNGNIKLIEAKICNSSLDVTSSLFFNDEFYITIDIIAYRDVSNASMFVLIRSSDGNYIASPFQADSDSFFSLNKDEKAQVVIMFSELGLLPGNYLIDIGIFDSNFKFLDWVESALGLEIVQEAKIKGRFGSLSPKVQWKVEKKV